MGITYLTLVGAIAIALSLVVERTLEIVKSVYDLIDSRFDLYHYWTRRAEAIRGYVEHRLRLLEYLEPEAVTQQLGRYDDYLLGKSDGYQGTIPIISADLVRAAALRIALKLLGMLIGVAIAFALRLDLVRLFDMIGASGVAPTLSGTMGKIATGIAIGLGSGPMHKVLVALEERRTRRLASMEVARV